MNDRENFQVGDARFTLLATSPNRAVVLYDIRPAPGRPLLAVSC